MILAGTGHRPGSGRFKSPLDSWPTYDSLLVQLMNFLRPHVRQWKSEDPSLEIITGGALGFDFAWAMAAHVESVPFHVYVPCSGQESRWRPEQQRRYHKMLSSARSVVTVFDGPYQPYVMQQRNEAMVDAADRVIALWDGSNGGTGNCVRYAEKVNKPIVNLYGDWIKYVN